MKSAMVVLAVSAVGVLGCHHVAPPTTPQPVLQPPARPASRPASRNANADTPLPAHLAPPPMRYAIRRTGDTPADAKPLMAMGTRFDIYDILVPFGAVSRNDAFWKRIDEEHIEPGTYDTLRRNGIRMGVDRMDDWPALHDLLSGIPATTHVTSATGREVANMELPLQHDIISESIFVFLPDGSLVGRSYERCEHFLNLSFEQTPRKPGDVRIALSPVVRSMRKQLVYSAMGNEGELSYIYPEKVLDVTLRTDVPKDDVLIISPSEEAKVPESLGRAFLTQPAPTERQEHLLVLVPRMFELDAKPQ